MIRGGGGGGGGGKNFRKRGEEGIVASKNLKGNTSEPVRGNSIPRAIGTCKGGKRFGEGFSEGCEKTQGGVELVWGLLLKTFGGGR